MYGIEDGTRGGIVPAGRNNSLFLLDVWTVLVTLCALTMMQNCKCRTIPSSTKGRSYGNMDRRRREGDGRGNHSVDGSA